MNRRIGSIAIGTVAVLVGAVLVLASQVSVIAAPSAAPAQQAQPTPTPMTLQQLSDIQPGLGTIMIEYSHRMSAMWFAEQAGNWDFADYQLIEMREIQEVGETTRPREPRAEVVRVELPRSTGGTDQGQGQGQVRGRLQLSYPGLQLLPWLANQRRLATRLQVHQGPGAHRYPGEYLRIRAIGQHARLGGATGTGAVAPPHATMVRVTLACWSGALVVSRLSAW